MVEGLSAQLRSQVAWVSQSYPGDQRKCLVALGLELYGKVRKIVTPLALHYSGIK